MDLTSYVSNHGREFATHAEAGGDDAPCTLVQHLTGSLKSGIRTTQRVKQTTRRLTRRVR
ncbi:hypothetical protein [Rhodococcus wratislaviensis]|uniref:hypothetical protein n=1 Tax=Rhodococcus wratislaviensis TaxID=44752 RepID=UPI00365D0478